MRPNSIFIQALDLNDLSFDSIICSPLLSQQVIEQAKNLTGIRKKQFVACRYLLAKLLNDHFEIISLPKIETNNNQRPQFEQSDLPDFNISHSGNHIAVAVSSKGKIGLDIEVDRPRNKALTVAKEIFSAQENSWLNQQIDPIKAFWQLWTLREAALKLYAKGVWQMKDMQITMPDQHITANFASDFYPHHQQLEHIYMSICCSVEIDSIAINE